MKKVKDDIQIKPIVTFKIEKDEWLFINLKNSKNDNKTINRIYIVNEVWL